MKSENEIANIIVGAAYRISSKLGPGLMESAYESILSRDLVRVGLGVERQKWVSFDYDGIWLENAFRVDLLIEGKVVVEIKSKENLHPDHFKQVLTYIRIMDCRLGLLINFGCPVIKDGIKRVVNRL